MDTKNSFFWAKITVLAIFLSSDFRPLSVGGTPPFTLRNVRFFFGKISSVEFLWLFSLITSLSLTRATHISGLSFCSFVGLIRSFLPAIYCLFEEKTHHIFNSRKISHVWITSLIQGLQECQGDVHAWCIKSMPLDDVDQLHSFRNKDNLPPVSCLASYNSDIGTICFSWMMTMGF